MTVERTLLLGRCLLFMTALGLVDCVLAWALPVFIGENYPPPLVTMFIHWDLPSHASIPVLAGVVLVPFFECVVGNGYGLPFYCGALWPLVIALGAIPVLLS